MTARLNGQELPEGWVWTTLDEVRYDISTSITPSKTPEQTFELYSVPSMETGRPEVVQGKEIGSSKRTVAEDTVLLCKINPRINRVWRVGNCSSYPQIASTEWIPFFKVDAIVPDYLAFYLRQNHIRDYLSQNASGVGGSLMRVKPSTLFGYPFPLAPLNEQHRIVDAIETQFTRLDAAVTALKRSQANLKRYRASVLKAACEGRLVPTEAALAQTEGRSYEPASVLLYRILAERRQQWEAENPKKRYKEPVAPDTSDLPALPEGWCWAGPEQLASFEKYALAIGPFGSNLLVSDYQDSGVPLVFVRNIRSGNFEASDSAFVTHSKAGELHAHRIDGGDVLITKMGDPPGDACLYPLTRPSAIITADCIKWRLSSVFVAKLYFVHIIHSEVVHRQILKETRGVAQKKISLARFKTVSIPLPPLAEQYRIVAEVERRLSLIDQLEKTVAADLARANRLRQSILKRAFAGQLVPQDPNDEPASVLLERIQAAKNGEPVQTRLPLR